MSENEKQAEEKETKVLEPSQFIVPVCCREGHENCPHIPKKLKRQKTNVGL